MAVKIREGQVNNEITSMVKDCYSFSDSFCVQKKTQSCTCCRDKNGDIPIATLYFGLPELTEHTDMSK